MDTEVISRAVVAHLTPDLLTPQWRAMARTPLSGHCYVASEAAWHLLGAFESPWRPRVARVDGTTHWWLAGPEGVMDLTAAQFDHPVEYSLGRPCGFLTRAPSRRARILMDRVLPDLARSAVPSV